MPALKIVQIDNEQLCAIYKANEVIRTVREKLIYGSANQGLNKLGIRKQSAANIGWLQHESNQQNLSVSGKSLSQQDHWLSKPGRMAPLVLTAQAGNCQDMAPLTHELCRDKFDRNVEVNIINDTANGHMFSVIHINNNITIAVDPWPVFPQALLFENHFCYYSNNSFSGKRRLGISNQPNKKPRYDKMQERKNAISGQVTLPNGPVRSISISRRYNDFNLGGLHGDFYLYTSYNTSTSDMKNHLIEHFYSIIRAQTDETNQKDHLANQFRLLAENAGLIDKREYYFL